MNKRQKEVQMAAAGTGLNLTDAEKNLLKKYNVKLWPGAPKALLQTTGEKPDKTLVENIETIVSKAGRELHHIHLNINQ